MKKYFYRTATFMCLAALVVFASCKKEDVKVLFTGTIEQPTIQGKTSIEIEARTHVAVVKWEDDDQIALYNDDLTRYTLSADPTGDHTIANFVITEPVGEGPYTAIYPAALALESSPYLRSCTLPEVQDATHFKAPMHAYCAAGDNNLRFENFCGVIQLNLPNVTKTITSVVLYTQNNVIAGTINYRASLYLGYLGIDVEGEGHTVTLDCGAGITGNAGPFYIYLPQDEYSAMTFTIYAEDGSYAVKSFTAETDPSTGDPIDPIDIVHGTYYPTTFSSLSNADFVSSGK